MPYDSGGGHRTPRRAPYQPSDYDEVSSQIPLWGDWSGARGRIQAGEDASAEDQNRAYWDSLNAPTADQLTAQYDYSPEGLAAQRQALSQMQEWGRGGITSADRAMMDAGRARDEQSTSAQRQALMQQAQARGMGGSGAELASQMSANQQGQMQSSDREATAMASAQQRALQAVQQSGQMGTQMRAQGQHETERQADANVAGVQGAFDNAATRAAGATGQYSQDASTRQQARDRQQESDDSLLGFLGSL